MVSVPCVTTIPARRMRAKRSVRCRDSSSQRAGPIALDQTLRNCSDSTVAIESSPARAYQFGDGNASGVGRPVVAGGANRSAGAHDEHQWAGFLRGCGRRGQHCDQQRNTKVANVHRPDSPNAGTSATAANHIRLLTVSPEDCAVAAYPCSRPERVAPTAARSSRACAYSPPCRWPADERDRLPLSRHAVRQPGRA